MRTGANERPTPLARKRMQNAGRKLLFAAYELQKEIVDKKHKKDALPEIVVCKPGDKKLHAPPQTLGLGRKVAEDAPGKGGKGVEKKPADKLQIGKLSKKKRMIVSEFEGPNKFDGGRMILQGGLPELGKNRLH